MFVSNKRQNGWTDRAQIFCGTSRDYREGLWMIKISNNCLHQNSIIVKFLKILKIHEIFCENPRIILFCFTMYTKRTCPQLIYEDGREAPSKASISNFSSLDLAEYIGWNIKVNDIKLKSNSFLQIFSPYILENFR